MLRRRSHRRRLGPPTGISRGAGPGRELGCGCDCRASAALDLGGPRRSGSAFTRAPSSREALWSLYTRGRAGAGLLIRRSGDTPCVPRPFPAGRVAFHSVVLNKHQWNPPSLRTGGFRRSRARVARPGLRDCDPGAPGAPPRERGPAHQVRPGARPRASTERKRQRAQKAGESPRSRGQEGEALAAASGRLVARAGAHERRRHDHVEAPSRAGVRHRRRRGQEPARLRLLGPTHHHAPSVPQR